MLGAMLWSETLFTTGTRTGNAASDTGLYVGPVANVVLADPDGTVRCHSVAQTQINTATHSSGAFLANADYYLYLRVASNGAAPAYRVSSVPPSDGRIWHPSNPTWRYIGSFTTNSAGAPRPMRCVRGRYTYALDDADGAAEFDVWNADAGGVAQDIPLQGIVPASARIGTFKFTLTTTGAAAAYQVYRSNIPGNVFPIAVGDAPAAGSATVQFTADIHVEPDGTHSSTLNYIASGGNGATLQMQCVGYVEGGP